MSAWVKNLVMIMVLAVWSVAVLVVISEGRMPDVTMWGIPGALYVLINPPIVARVKARADGGRHES